MDTNVPSRFRRTAAAAVAAVVVLPPTSAPACDGADAQIAGVSISTIRSATVCLLNRRRASHGLRRLRRERDLRQAAQAYAEQMINGGFFGHVSAAGGGLVDRLKASGFITPDQSWLAGENLAWGAGALGTPRAIVREWMQSPGHRANVLDPRFHHVGVGVAAGAPQPFDGAAATYAAEFGD
jgi:uncharacterized protein YkwD